MKTIVKEVGKYLEFLFYIPILLTRYPVGC